MNRRFGAGHEPAHGIFFIGSDAVIGENDHFCAQGVDVFWGAFQFYLGKGFVLFIVAPVDVKNGGVVNIIDDDIQVAIVVQIGIYGAVGVEGFGVADPVVEVGECQVAIVLKEFTGY